MEYMGTYHADAIVRTAGVCDAPRTCKGRMSVAGFESFSNARGMALAQGRMRNRSALAKELGCPAFTSQAELALRAYERWGEDYPQHIEGPCMSCVADVERDWMLVSRDRMGECPLFYAEREGQLMFADHPDVFLKSGFVAPVLDRQGLCEIFALGPARTPGRTPLRGIAALEPGCMLVCSGGRIAHKRYFELRAEPTEDALPAAAERVRALLEAAVGDTVHLHPACMLSGGLDSTALTALLCMRIGRVDSFSVDYEGNEQDFVSNAFRPEMDAPYVRLAVKTFGTRHRQIVLSQEALCASLERAVRLRGFPGMADIDSSLLLFAREILRHAPSVLSGECGDEVFGGYPWFREDAPLPQESFPWSGSMALRERILRPEIREKARIAAYARDALHASLESYDVSNVEGAQERALFKLQRLCFDYFMPNLQERAVCMCAGQGLNVLTPLCDDRLVRYVYNVPWRIKRSGGMEKGLFREAMRDVLPEKLRLRKKSPYPKTCSPAYSDAVRARLRELFAQPDAPLWQIVDRGEIEHLAGTKLNPADAPWFGQLMAGPQMLAYLLQLNAWLRERNVQIELDS